MNILIIYDNYSPLPLRQALFDHLASFGRYSDHDVYYCNYAYGLPHYLQQVSFDLIIFHYFFATQFRWNGIPYEQYLQRLVPLKESSAKKVLFCQDEYVKTKMIERFIADFGITTLFSVADPSQWNAIYPHVDRSRVAIHQVLTGYLDDGITSVIATLKGEGIARTFDIGYHASATHPALGRHGKAKTDIAHAILGAANHLNTAISTSADEATMLAGWDWYRFLLSCKGTIGVEGGSSILDADGTITAHVYRYCEAHPQATFEEVEAACFPGKEGSLNLTALSPRHLEACATRTCQLLIEGDYSGVLKPHLHYIPLKRDFSNIDHALEQLQCPTTRARITSRAYDDIVASGRYTYSSFVDTTLALCPTSSSPRQPIHYAINQMRERFLKKRMPCEFYLFPKVKRLLPRAAITKLKAMRNRL